jgi:ribulose-phosphate 3-epimerase
MTDLRLAPSLLSADFADLRGAIESVEAAGVSILHVDVMDGHFVPNITFGPLIVDAIRRIAHSDLDVHLMIDDPGFYLERFIKAGAAYLTFHCETVGDARPLVEKSRSLGVKGGVALSPATPLDVAAEVLEVADLVVVMTVHPGFGGQGFIREVVPKIRALYELRRARDYDFEIEVDGGVTVDTAPVAAWAGADILVAGAAVFKTDDPQQAIHAIAEAAQQGLARRDDSTAFPLNGG